MGTGEGTPDLTAIEAAYLSASDCPGGSGYRGGHEGWERARRVIIAAVHHDGTFLDVGCANGLLMESVVRWAADEGYVLEPHGLDISARLADRARWALPQWADRIHVGDVMTWAPPQRYDFVRIELVYAPGSQRSALLQRCLRELVADEGRLIVCSYREQGERHARSPAADVERRAVPVSGSAEAFDTDGAVVTSVVWVDK